VSFRIEEPKARRLVCQGHRVVQLPTGGKDVIPLIMNMMDRMNHHVVANDQGARTRIIVISMPEAADRRSRFEERARGAQVPWGFFAALSALHPDLSYDEQEAIIAKGRPLRAGELGCYSSHYAAWEELQTDHVDQYVVLEDDVIVDWAFVEKLVEIDFAAMGIRYLRLYYKTPTRHAILKENFLEQSRSIVELSGAAFGTQGYLITKAGARTLLDHCRAVRRPIDDEMDRSWAHGLPNLAIFPFPIIEESAPSSIGYRRFETFVVPQHLKLKRLFTRRVERWRRDAERMVRRFRRFQARWQAKI
jgi:glycosyl transferase family 25